MTISKAITEAMKEFNRTTGKEKKAEIRNICLQEGSGKGDKWTELVIKIEYAIDGDYTESELDPFYAVVNDYEDYDNYGVKKVVARKIRIFA